jgi:NAD(P)-dependent dehydrogenase (short-subunit alcohol dehydrogenase family)
VPQSPDLSGTVAVVTGATRGVGKGVAAALIEAGAIVYTTGRSVSDDADRATRDRTGGGALRALRCDHSNDADTKAVFELVVEREGHLDLLVNAAWSGYERMVDNGQFTWSVPFWQQPMWRWDAMFDGGVRALFACSRYAARQMVAQRTGLIANVSFWAAQKYVGNTIYGAAKIATDRLTSDMAHELAEHGVAVVSVYPGLVRTELVMQAAESLDLSNSESPEFTGRAIAHLYADGERFQRTGSVVVAAAYAREVGFSDIDGRRPNPLTVESV